MQDPRHAAIAEARRLRQRRALPCRARNAATSRPHLQQRLKQTRQSCRRIRLQLVVAAGRHAARSVDSADNFVPRVAASADVAMLKTAVARGRSVSHRARPNKAGRCGDATLRSAGRCAPVARDDGCRALPHRPIYVTNARVRQEGRITTSPIRGRCAWSSRTSVLSGRSGHARRTTKMHGQIVHLRRHAAGRMPAGMGVCLCGTASQTGRHYETRQLNQ